MNEIAAFMVISLMTRSRVGWDERMHRYPLATEPEPSDGTAVCRLGKAAGMAPLGARTLPATGVARAPAEAPGGE